MTVAENMSYSLRLRRTAKERIAAAISGAAAKLGLDALMARRPRALSGGQRQRVAMGRAIVRAPKAFLFDEPLSNLDARLREQMRGEIKKLHQSLGATSIYVTHDQIEAMTLADRIVAMNGGVVQQVGSPLDLYDRPANLFVAGFIGSPAMNMFDGIYRAHGAGPAVEVQGGARIALGRAYQAQDGAQVTAGMRPEHIPVGATAEPGIPCNVELVEPTGFGTILHVRPFGTILKAFTLERDAAAIGDAVSIRLPAERLHLFDGQSGQRLA
jgi:multiple sugar transport system ATP-binding protein